MICSGLPRRQRRRESSQRWTRSWNLVCRSLPHCREKCLRVLPDEDANTLRGCVRQTKPSNEAIKSATTKQDILPVPRFAVASISASHKARTQRNSDRSLRTEDRTTHLRRAQDRTPNDHACILRSFLKYSSSRLNCFMVMTRVFSSGLLCQESRKAHRVHSGWQPIPQHRKLKEDANLA
jgi:hypothetical protein